MRSLFAILIWLLAAPVWAGPLTDAVEKHSPNIIKGSVKTAAPVIADILAVGTEEAQTFLANWQQKELWFVKETNQIVRVSTEDKKSYTLFDIETNASLGEASKKEIKQIKPNSGLRKMLGSSLVAGRLTSPDLKTRMAAIDALSRDPKAEHLGPLQQAISSEEIPSLRDKMLRLERLLTVQFGEDEAARVVAIESFAGEMTVEARGVLTALLSSKTMLATDVPDGANIAAELTPGSDLLSFEDASALLIDAGLVEPNPNAAERKQAISANLVDGFVGGIPVEELSSQTARDRAYLKLVEEGKAPPWDPEQDMAKLVTEHSFVDVYDEPSFAVTEAASETLGAINARVARSQLFDLLLDGISLGSIYFLAAIGLAITFGVMRVINMAHGEFIMMGAYTGYVVQQFIANHTLSLLVAVPLAFAITFAAGVIMERLVIRHLYHRPLETLLATFGISIALQQIAKNIFGTQARPLTAPEWLNGAMVINDVVQISWIRIAIFVLSAVFFLALLIILNRTRLGLETRAVTQNPRMAASMGINTDRINMLTFGLGSGIAGVAGIAIGLFAKVTSELGSDYIVQSFMTVVVGGVGNIFGTLAGAAMIGFLQKGIEWFNPSNTLAAQTYMIIFIIVFIQFRPRGIIALKGRAAGD